MSWTADSQSLIVWRSSGGAGRQVAYVVRKMLPVVSVLENFLPAAKATK